MDPRGRPWDEFVRDDEIALRCHGLPADLRDGLARRLASHNVCDRDPKWWARERGAGITAEDRQRRWALLGACRQRGWRVLGEAHSPHLTRWIEVEGIAVLDWRGAFWIGTTRLGTVVRTIDRLSVRIGQVGTHRALPSPMAHRADCGCAYSTGPMSCDIHVCRWGGGAGLPDVSSRALRAQRVLARHRASWALASVTWDDAIRSDLRRVGPPRSAHAWSVVREDGVPVVEAAPDPIVAVRWSMASLLRQPDGPVISLGRPRRAQPPPVPRDVREARAAATAIGSAVARHMLALPGAVSVTYAPDPGVVQWSIPRGGGSYERLTLRPSADADPWREARRMVLDARDRGWLPAARAAEWLAVGGWPSVFLAYIDSIDDTQCTRLEARAERRAAVRLWVPAPDAPDAMGPGVSARGEVGVTAGRRRAAIPMRVVAGLWAAGLGGPAIATVAARAGVRVSSSAIGRVIEQARDPAHAGWSGQRPECLAAEHLPAATLATNLDLKREAR